MSQELLKQILATDFKHATEHDLKQTRIEYGRGLDYYRKRIDAIQFCGFSHVLDAASGWGQWSIVLSESNQFVSAIDLNPGGLEIAITAAHLCERENIRFSRGNLHFLPYKENSFDAVFCYGALMYTRENIALRELSRVLRPSGKIYICSNGPAWPFYKILIMGLSRLQARPVLSGLKMLFVTFFYNILRGQYSAKLTFIRKRDLRQLCALNNLRLSYYGPEGSFGNPDGRQFQPIYGKTFWGLPSDFEILGEKHGGAGG